MLCYNVAFEVMTIRLKSFERTSAQFVCSIFSRKPAARLGEVIFANKVSLGGLGAERPERIKNQEIRW